MEIGPFLVRLLPVLGALAIASIIETLVPLRRQSRRANGRLATNLWLLAITLTLATLLNFALALGAAYVGQSGLGLLQLLGLFGAIASFIVALIALDGATYLAHRLMHQMPLLWRVHLVHHSDAAVDATTAFRQHPIEGVVRFGFIAVTALALGAPPVAIAVYRLLRTQRRTGAREHPRATSARPCAGVALGNTRHAQGSSLARPRRDGFELREPVLVLRSCISYVHGQQPRSARFVRNGRLRRARAAVDRRSAPAAVPRTRLAGNRRRGDPGCCRRKQ